MQIAGQLILKRVERTGEGVSMYGRECVFRFETAEMSGRKGKKVAFWSRLTDQRKVPFQNSADRLLIDASLQVRSAQRSI